MSSLDVNLAESMRSTALELESNARFETFRGDEATETKKCPECGEPVDRKPMITPGNYFYPCGPCGTRAEIASKEAAARYKRERAIEQAERAIKFSTPIMYREIDYPKFDDALFGNAFLVFGDFGTGKTYTAYALAHKLMRGLEINSFTITRAFKMMMDIKASFSSSSYDAFIRGLEMVQLLIIDEWGKNSGTDFEEAVLFEIINKRYENGRRTGIIVNAKKKDDLLTLIRPDVLDRFRRGIVEINGKSRR